MAPGGCVRIEVIGRFRVLVDGEDRSEALTPTQRSVLAVLAAAWREPVGRDDLCASIGISPRSLDPALSRLRQRLGVASPLHVSGAPEPGMIGIADGVESDVADLITAAEMGRSTPRSRRWAAATEADDRLWRGQPFDGFTLVRTDLTERLVSRARHARAALVDVALTGLPDEPKARPLDRLLAWIADDVVTPDLVVDATVCARALNDHETAQDLLGLVDEPSRRWIDGLVERAWVQPPQLDPPSGGPGDDGELGALLEDRPLVVVTGAGADDRVRSFAARWSGPVLWTGPDRAAGPDRWWRTLAPLWWRLRHRGMPNPRVRAIAPTLDALMLGDGEPEGGTAEWSWVVSGIDGMLAAADPDTLVVVEGVDTLGPDVGRFLEVIAGTERPVPLLLTTSSSEVADPSLAAVLRSAPTVGGEVTRGATHPPPASPPPAPAGALTGPLLATTRRAMRRMEMVTAAELADLVLSQAGPAERHEALSLRAEAHRLLGRWGEVEADARELASSARQRGDLSAELDAYLLLARVTWDPDRFDADSERRLTELSRHDGLDPHQRAIALACLSGGLYQSGHTDDARVDQARRAEAMLDLDAPSAAEALVWSRKALLGVDPPREQLARSTSVVELAPTPAIRAAGLLGAVVDMLELGDIAGARRYVDRHAALVEEHPTTFLAYQQANLEATVALIDGEDDAAARITDAERLGRGWGSVTVAQVAAGQRFWLSSTGGGGNDLADWAPVVEAFADDTGVALWRAAAALGLALVDRPLDASRRLGELCDETRRFADLPPGNFRLPTLALAARAAWTLAAMPPDWAGAGRAASAGAALASQLEDVDRSAVLVGWPTVWLGPVDRFRALASAAAGDVEAADRHFARALRASGDAPGMLRIVWSERELVGRANVRRTG